MLDEISREDMIRAYQEAGSFRRGGILLGMEKLSHPVPSKTFKKLWWEKVNVDPQDLKPMPKARSIAVVSDTHLGHKRQQLTH